MTKNICQHGMANINGRLDEADVLAIYFSKHTQAVIAQRHGVTQSSVSHIKNGRTHSHITGHPYTPKTKKPRSFVDLGC